MARPLHQRFASYVLVAILSIGAMGAPSAVQAAAPEERREVAGSQSGSERLVTTSHWAAVSDDAPSFSFQTWLTNTFHRLIGLTAVIRSVFSHTWKWTDSKPNTCR